jgi:hypothetical protein
MTLHSNDNRSVFCNDTTLYRVFFVRHCTLMVIVEPLYDTTSIIGAPLVRHHTPNNRSAPVFITPPPMTIVSVFVPITAPNDNRMSLAYHHTLQRYDTAPNKGQERLCTHWPLWTERLCTTILHSLTILMKMMFPVFKSSMIEIWSDTTPEG